MAKYGLCSTTALSTYGYFSTLLSWKKSFIKETKPSGRRRTNEAYIRLTEQWHYYHKAVVDKEGCMIDFLMSAKRDEEAALRFLTNPIQRNITPSLHQIFMPC